MPTFSRSRLKGAPSQTWYGLFAPAGTPSAIVDKLNTEVTAVMNEPGFKDKFIIQRGLVPAIGTPDDFAAEISVTVKAHARW